MSFSCRLQLVARQIKAQELSPKSYFTPAPPFEAARAVSSMATTEFGNHKPMWDLSSPQMVRNKLVDIKRGCCSGRAVHFRLVIVRRPRPQNDGGAAAPPYVWHTCGFKPLTRRVLHCSHSPRRHSL